MKCGRLLLTIGLATSTVALLTAAPAQAGSDRASRPVPVSGRSPFPLGCSGAGRGFAHGAAVEPSLAVDPAIPSHLAAIWQQDRATTGPGGAQGLVTAFSGDSGRHWRRVALPFVSRCSGGIYRLASDPWLSFSSDGRILYASSLVFDGNNPVNSLLVSTSRDGGQTWSRPATIIHVTNAPYINDKESVTADPFHRDVAYMVWDRLNPKRGNGQPVWFAKTTNGGLSWSQPRKIYDPTAEGASTEGNIVTVLPDGTLVDVFLYAAIGLIPPDGPAVPAARPAATGGVPAEIRAVISHDQGRTWSGPVVVARIGFRDHAIDPDTGTRIRTGGNLPAVATDPRTGRIYVTWAGAGMSSSGSAVGLVSSADGGLHWTRPLRINQTPDSPRGGNGQAFIPAISVTPNGTIGVSYYDLRENTPAPGLPAMRWLVTCRGAVCLRTAGAWREQPLLGPFNLELAPRIAGGGYFLGDYMGQAAAGDSLLTLATATTRIPGNQQNEYFQRVRSG
ncbi:MAG TPA: sialidase family protein [Streptosporangiaceae bacterium]|nr:sialidase family protein [Streptosporangiaceae bacterium]